MMNPKAIISALETYSHDTDHLLGTFSKVIGSQPGDQATAILMVFEKYWVKTIEEAYALWLLDAANSPSSIGIYVADLELKVPKLDNSTKPVGDIADWKMVQWLVSKLDGEGVHIPSRLLHSGTLPATLQQNSVKQAFGLSDGGLDETVIIEVEYLERLEVERAFIVMHWETSA